MATAAATRGKNSDYDIEWFSASRKGFAAEDWMSERRDGMIFEEVKAVPMSAIVRWANDGVGTVCVEVQSWSRRSMKYEDSGLRTTKALLFTFVCDTDSGTHIASFTVPVSRMKLLCDDLPNSDANRFGKNPTRIVKLPIADVFSMKGSDA